MRALCHALIGAILLSLAGASAPVAAQRAQLMTQGEIVARVLATGGVNGRFATPVCDRFDTLRPTPEAEFTFALMRSARESDRPMVIDTGGLFAPHGVARFAAGHRPGSLARLADELGYRALSVGETDLGSPRDGLVAVAGRLRRRGIPMIASNLRCAPEASELCEVLVDASDGPSIHEVGDRRMAVISVLRPQVVEIFSPDRARGLHFDPAVATIERLVPIARERGADLVLVVADPRIVEGGVIELAASLPEYARPDLMLASGEAGPLLSARPRTMRPAIAAPPPDDALEIVLRESIVLHDGYEVLSQRLEGRGIDVGRPVLDWIDRVGEAYCDAWGRPLRGGHLEREVDVAEMLDLMAGILRDATGADVALMNRSLLDTRWRPSRPGELTSSDVFIALQRDDPLQRASVTDAWLRQVAAMAAGGALTTPGLTWAAGDRSAIKVGGHPVESRARYEVVAPRLLATTLLPALPAGSEWETFEEGTLRSVVLSRLDLPRDGDPRDALPPANETIQWLFRADAALTFSASSINSPRRPCDPDDPPERCQDGFQVDEMGATSAAYSVAPLNRQDTVTFGFDVNLAADAAAPDWTWQNNASFVYRTAWVEGRGGVPGAFAEAVDQIRGRSTLSWRGLRPQNGDHWFLPDPTVEVFVESEFNAPDDREWHWLLLRPTVGGRFQLLDKLQFQINGGLQAQLLDPELPVHPGVGAILTLSPWEFLKMEGRAGRIGFTFDYFLSDLGDSNQHAFRGELDAAFDLVGFLSLTLNVRVFVQQSRDWPIGAAIDATAGIRVQGFGRAVGP